MRDDSSAAAFEARFRAVAQRKADEALAVYDRIAIDPGDDEKTQAQRHAMAKSVLTHLLLLRRVLPGLAAGTEDAVSDVDALVSRARRHATESEEGGNGG